MRKASPGLSPTAAVIIHKAQAGRFSIAHVPPLHRQGHIALGMVNELLIEGILIHGRCRWCDAEHCALAYRKKANSIRASGNPAVRGATWPSDEPRVVLGAYWSRVTLGPRAAVVSLRPTVQSARRFSPLEKRAHAVVINAGG